MSVFVDCVKSGDSIKCPGDGGYSEVVVFGKHMRLRKDHPAIELMGRLDELEALAEWALVELNNGIFGKVAALAVALNTYLATGNEEWVQRARQIIGEACEVGHGRLGWFIPMSRDVAFLNILRVKAREAERTAVTLLDEDLPNEKVRNIVASLNQANKYIAQLIYLSEESVFTSAREKIEELINRGGGLGKRL
jgi:cob(I)alamin adenosyltransferase